MIMRIELIFPLGFASYFMKDFFMAILIVFSLAACSTQPRTFDQPIPGTTNKAANSKQIAAAQKLLMKKDFNPGAADGINGKRTAAAVIAFQKTAELTNNATISDDLITTLQNYQPTPQRTSLSAKDGVPNLAALNEAVRQPELACVSVDTVDKLAECLWSTTIYKNGGPRSFGDLMARAMGQAGTLRSPTCHQILDEVDWTPWHGTWPQSKRRLDYYYPNEIKIDIVSCDDAKALVLAMSGMRVVWEKCPHTQNYSYQLLETCLDEFFSERRIKFADKARKRNLAILPTSFHEKYFAKANYGIKRQSQIKSSLREDVDRCINLGFHHGTTASEFANLVGAHERTLSASNTLEGRLKKQVTCDDLLTYASKRGMADSDALTRMADKKAETPREITHQPKPNQSNQLVYESCNWTKSRDQRVIQWCECMRDQSAGKIELLSGTTLSMFHYWVAYPSRSPLDLGSFEVTLERKGATRSEVLGGGIAAQIEVGKLIPICTALVDWE